MAKQKRDNHYYLKRLENEHPAIFADLKAGKFASARQALEAAKLKRPQRPINVLKSVWKNTSAKEKADFLSWATGSTSSTTFLTAIDGDRRLLPAVAARIGHIMVQRKLKTGDVMDEMGLKRLNPALGSALAQGTRVPSDFDQRLVKWLDSQKRV